MAFFSFLVSSEEFDNAKFFTWQLYPFYVTINIMELLEFLSLSEGNLYNLECVLGHFPVFKIWVNENRNRLCVNSTLLFLKKNLPYY